MVLRFRNLWSCLELNSGPQQIVATEVSMCLWYVRSLSRWYLFDVHDYTLSS